MPGVERVQTMRDPVLIEVLKNRFQAIVDEMGFVILKTGYTVFVKETGDFGAALVSPQGEVFAVPLAIGVASMVGRPMQDTIAFVGEPEEGDVFIANDPETTKGLSTHLNDLFVWKPVFHEGRVVCYALTFIHASDVGGRVPGSIAPSSREIFEEGLILPPTRLVHRGEHQREVVEILKANSRVPEQNWGDIRALVAAVNVAEERVRNLIRKYGSETFERGVEAVLDYAEVQARTLIEQIPDGDYTFADYMEGAVGDDEPILIKLTLRVRGSNLVLDFTGTDPQVQSAFNLPSHSQRGHWCLVRGLVDYFRSTIRDITHNSGLVRPVEVVAPRGSLLNPYPPAAVGVRAATILRVYDVTMAALAQAVSDRIPAAGSGQASILLVTVPGLRGGQTRMSVVQPLVGGSGARPFKDGVDGADTASGYLRNVPAEAIENEIPILIRQYGLRPDSGGPGAYRGGTGIALEFEVLSPKAIVTARGLERYRFAPWGLFSGWPGATGRTTLNPGTPGERDLGRLDVLELQRGDVLRLETQGGGGYGLPSTRDLVRVLSDFRRGLVSIEQARSAYGVVITNGEIDQGQTERLRDALARRAGPVEIFGVGDARKAYEARWPEALRRAVQEALAQYSGLAQEVVSRVVRQKIEAVWARDGSLALEEVDALVRAVMVELGFVAEGVS